METFWTRVLKSVIPNPAWSTLTVSRSLCCALQSRCFLMLFALSPFSEAIAEDGRTTVKPPGKLAMTITRCADPRNAAVPDCRFGASASATKTLAPDDGYQEESQEVPARGSTRQIPISQSFAKQELVMFAGEVVVLNIGALDRVAVGNGKIAATTVLDKKRLLIIAQDVGDTNILLWNAERPLRDIRLRVTAQNLERVKREAADLLSEIPGLRIRSVGDRIFIEGVNLSEVDVGRVKALAAQYPNIIDRTVGRFRPSPTANPAQMIMFDLYFVEFKKSFLQNLGVNWQRSFNGFNFGVYGEATRGPVLLRPGVSSTGDASTLPPTRRIGLSTAANIALSLPATIELAVDSGDAVLLAAPKIASRSGGKAKFTAGGELPLPSTSQQGTNVTFKPYGILLEVEPQINSDGSVSGIVHAEVSAIDPAISVLGIPAFLTRRTEANFFSKDGEAVVLSGLYNQELSKSEQKVPLLGDMPLIGALFSSKSEVRRSSELVVFIVPHVHGADTAMNQKLLKDARKLVDRQTHKLGGADDFLPKLQLSSELWQNDLSTPTPPAKPKSPARAAQPYEF